MCKGDNKEKRTGINEGEKKRKGIPLKDDKKPNDGTGGGRGKKNRR